MEESTSLAADSSLASQWIPKILYNPKVNYHIHKRPTPVPVLSESSPIYASPSTILPSDLPTKILCAPLLSPARDNAPPVSFLIISPG